MTLKKYLLQNSDDFVPVYCSFYKACLQPNCLTVRHVTVTVWRKDCGQKGYEKHA